MPSEPVTGRLIVASSADSADIRYGSTFNAPDEFVYVELPGGERLAIVSILELARARRETSPAVQVLNSADFLRRGPDGGRLPLLIGISRYYGIEKWLVPDKFPLGHAERLRAYGIAVECVKGAFFPARAVKTAAEVEAVAEAMRATEDAMKSVENFVRDSTVNAAGELEYRGRVLTCEFIRSEVEAEFKRRSFTAERTIIACGPDAAAPHCIGFGPVRAGQPLVADIFPRSDVTGYWGDMTRTFVKGRASEIVRRAFEAVKKASELALDHIRPGVPGALIHELAARSLVESGFPMGRDAAGNPKGFIHGLGHGVGLEIHENPRLSPSDATPLQPGQVVSVEPGLYDAAWGGIRLEDLVLVTETGVRNFCTMPKVLELP